MITDPIITPQSRIGGATLLDLGGVDFLTDLQRYSQHQPWAARIDTIIQPLLCLEPGEQLFPAMDFQQGVSINENDDEASGSDTSSQSSADDDLGSAPGALMIDPFNMLLTGVLAATADIIVRTNVFATVGSEEDRLSAAYSDHELDVNGHRDTIPSRGPSSSRMSEQQGLPTPVALYLSGPITQIHEEEGTLIITQSLRRYE